MEKEHNPMEKYDPYEFRMGNLILSKKDAEIMNILMDFGESVDGQGYDYGEYDIAFKSIQKIVKRAYLLGKKRQKNLTK